MTAETGRRASRLELIRARLHESGRRCARDGDATAPTPTTSVRSTVDNDVRPSAGRNATAHNGIRPALDRRLGSRVDGKSDRKVQSGNTNHARQVPIGRHAEVKGHSKLDAGVDEQEYAQVRKPALSSSAPADRCPADAEGTEGCQATPGHDDSIVSARRRPTSKTSSSSSLLSKSQNFFARLRSRKNDPAKSTCRDGGSGNESGSNGKIRRSVSDSGCAMYVNRREIVANNINSMDASQSSAHLDAVTSSDDVTTERQTVDQIGGPDTDGRDAVTNVATANVYAEVEPMTRRTLTSADVVEVTESVSGSERADTCPMPTAVYEECAGSYSLREALLQRGSDAAAVTETPTSVTFSHVIRRDSAASSPPSDGNRVPPRRAQTTSLLPVGGGRSTTVAGWRRRRSATTQSTGCVVAGRRDGRLERIQEVDSPPGSADDDEMALRSLRCASNTEQRLRFDATVSGSDARNRKFTCHISLCQLLFHINWFTPEYIISCYW